MIQLKWAKHLNRHFSKKIQLASKYLNRCAISLAVREIQIKTTRYHFITTRMAVINKKKKTITSFREDVENTKLSYIAGENVKCHIHFSKQFGSFSKINHRVSI